MSSTVGGAPAESPGPVRLERWEGKNAAELATAWRVPEAHLFARVASTNDVAHGFGRAGRPSGSVALAEEQTGGRGRGARSWASPPGVGLWWSFLFRPAQPSVVDRLPLRVALAVAAALDRWTAGAARVKWPNDLLLDERKFGGILCEAFWEGTRLDHVVIGIGLNLLQGADEFPRSLRDSATSVRAHAIRSVSRLEVSVQVARSLRSILQNEEVDDELDLISRFAGRDLLAGRPIEVLEPQTGKLLLVGEAAGIDAAGSLLVRQGSRLAAVRSGTVRLRRR